MELQRETIDLPKSSYEKESVKRALKKYYEKNKDRIQEYARNYVKGKYQTDPEYREQRKAYSRKYHQARKDLIKKLTESVPSVDSMG